MITQHACPSKPQLAFLVGLPRSGTTWLQRLLGSHPDIGTAQESHLFNHFLGSQIRAWDHLLNFEDGRGGIGVPAYQTENAYFNTLRRQVHETFAQADEYHSCQVFLEKTPDHIRHLLDIQRLFPEARIIIMTRDPKDVIESMLSANKGWGEKWAPSSIIQAIRLYHYYSKKAESDYQRANRSLIHQLSYEDLKADSNACISSLLNFLDLDNSAESVANLSTQYSPLNRYGEFARRSNSTRVPEPNGFARQSKGKLNVIQKLMVDVFVADQPLFARQTNSNVSTTLGTI